MNSELDPEQTSSSRSWQTWVQVLDHDPLDCSRQAPQLEVSEHPVANRVLALDAVWFRLKAGQIKITRTLFTDTHTSFLLAHCAPEAGRKALSERYAEILERTLLDAGPKVVASELGYSISGIGTILRQSLEFFGLTCKPSQVPALLVMAAAAARVQRPSADSDVAPPSGLSTHCSVVSAERPEMVLRNLISPAQLSVTSLLVEGKSYSEMACLRHTSERTIANQVAGTFRRLGVSGRAELLRYLIAPEALRRPAHQSALAG
jgi:DNA-binding CsgD family transcriptional regulator